MIRLACALALLAMVALLGMVVQTSGGTATLYVFIGIPALAAAAVVYLATEGAHLRRLLAGWLGGGGALGLALATCVLLGACAPAEAEAPAEAYGRLCASCHGPDGRGETPAGKAMKVPSLDAAALDDERLIRVVREDAKHKSVSGRVDDAALRAIGEHLRGLSP